MSFLSGRGPIAASEARLGTWLLVTSIVVVAVTAALVVAALVRSRRASPARETGEHSVVRSGGGLRWVVIGGVVVPAIVLLVTFAFTLGALRAVAAPPNDAAVVVRVIGHRWWWEIIYADSAPSRTVVTANELHLPVGRPVRLELVAADVIHSFWIPQLAGKTDLIPGQTNIAWIQADSAGIYRGQCTEYCGLQHANMALYAVAESPEAFALWLAGQRRSATEPGDAQSRAGRDVFRKSACATCHAIRGTDALGAVGPDLTHLASRLTIGAGVLENVRGNLAGWIGNSQAIKPGNDMPPMPLPPEQLQALLSYLETLR